jgi:Imidazolonepropionase and related amidohydrolases
MSLDRALVDCRIVEVEPEGRILESMTILIKDEGRAGGLIERIGRKSEVEVPSGCAVSDLGGAYVLPGLINAHVHLSGSGVPMRLMGGGEARKRAMRLLGTGLGKRVIRGMVRDHATVALMSGVTTLRGVGDLFYGDLRVRDEIDSRKLLGPRMLVAGSALCVTGGHGSGGFAVECDSPWEARKVVRADVREGVDLIKLCVTGGVSDARRVGEAGRLQMTVEEVTAACEEAHKVGLLVAAHVESSAGVRVALEGGVDTIEHGAPLDDGLIALFKHNPRSLRGYSALVVTLEPALLMNSIDPSMTKLDPVSQENSRLVFEGMVAGAKRAIEEGVLTGLGTDAGCPFVTHYSTWRELDYEAKYLGLSPARAIYAATAANARILGVDEVTGRIKPGASADLLVLRENPLEDLRFLAEPAAVIARGVYVDRPRVKHLRRLDETVDAVRE